MRVEHGVSKTARELLSCGNRRSAMDAAQQSVSCWHGAVTVQFYGHLRAHRPAQRCNTLALQFVVNLRAFAPLAQDASSVERCEVLGHVGLRGVDLCEQVGHIALTVAHGADDLQSNWC